MTTTDGYWTEARLRETRPKEPDPVAADMPGLVLRAAEPPIRVKDEWLTEFPFKAIGKLVFSWNGGSYQGTAFAYGPTLLVTAAHNVYDEGQWSSNLSFQLQASEQGNAGVFACTIGYILRGWSDTAESQYDIALLTTVGRPGDLGALDIFKPVPADLGDFVPVGYPASDWGGVSYDGRSMWYQLLEPKPEADGCRLAGPYALTKGMSGGPWLARCEPMGSAMNVALATHSNSKVISPGRQRVAGAAVWGQNMENLVAAQLPDNPPPAGITGALGTGAARVIGAADADGPHLWYTSTDPADMVVQFAFTFGQDPASRAISVCMQAINPTSKWGDFIAPVNGVVVHSLDRTYWILELTSVATPTTVTGYVGISGAGYLGLSSDGTLCLTTGKQTRWTFSASSG
ncbi:MAG: serine protease [Myxococcota bacterium]